MKNNFTLKLCLKDIIVAISAAVLIIVSLVFTNVLLSPKLSSKALVEIYYHETKLTNLTVDFSKVEDEIIIVLSKEEYPELLDDFTIVINKDKGICVKDITCPNHYCEKQGWVKRTNYPVTCLPNGVYVIMSNPSADDEILVG